MATILIVDDVAANRKFLVTLLRFHGHRVIEAVGGADALVVVRTDRPDLVITDVLMPDMDGYELVRQLRLDPALSRLPVVFYTAHYGEREARALALAGRVSYVLTKPAESEQVLVIVARALAGQSETGVPSTDTPLAPAFDREYLRLVTDKLSEKADDLRTANARLRAVINIGLELASERESDRLLHRVCAAARDLFGASYVTLGILDQQNQTVHRFLSCGTDASSAVHAGTCLTAGDPVPGIFRTVVVERRPLRGFNPGGDPTKLELPALHPEVQAFLAAPIASAAHVYGWICLVGNEGRTFADDDEQLVLALSGQVGRIYELEHEILERQHAESALRTAEERMRFALEAAGVGVWDIDYTTGVLRWSEILEAQYGLQPGTFGGTFEAFTARIHPDDRESVLETLAKAMKSGADFTVEHRTIWPDNTVRWLSGAGRIHLAGNGEPVRGLGISTDLTERRTLEAQYLQAQKMEAIGRLAGGVAHDFNNLLTVIIGYCELLLADLDPRDPRHDDISEIQKAGTSAAGLTRQLLAFSRKQIIEPTRLDLNAVVTTMLPMLGRLIGVDLKIVHRLAPELALLKADRGQMEQILMNLAVNARDAMPTGGTLTIETGNIELDEHYSKKHFSVKPGPYVVLTVTDTGAGMTPAVQARLFEPFFTTKEAGQGTGLGLATVHGIVSRSGGSVNVYSELGRGTSFKVYMPRADGSAAIPEAPTVDRPGGARETVLIVEDEDAIRELATRFLERQGYSVLVAANAEEAFRLVTSDATIDVLLTDVVMPGASGPELTNRLVALHPALKVIYMSGYTEAAIVQHGILNPGVAFLNKPFTSETLGRKIRQVLDREIPQHP
jgi:signal transduction histidine kinase/CheY-like chemotaxis protein